MVVVVILGRFSANVCHRGQLCLESIVIKVPWVRESGVPKDRVYTVNHGSAKGEKKLVLGQSRGRRPYCCLVLRVVSSPSSLKRAPGESRGGEPALAALTGEVSSVSGRARFAAGAPEAESLGPRFRGVSV
jgi:hypothetical protein